MLKKVLVLIFGLVPLVSQAAGLTKDQEAAMKVFAYRKSVEVAGQQVEARMPYEILNSIADQLPHSFIALLPEVNAKDAEDKEFLETWMKKYLAGKEFMPTMSPLKQHFGSQEKSLHFIAKFINHYGIESLDLSQMGRKDMSEKDVASILDECPSLKLLSLAHTRIQLRNLENISKALHHNDTLTSLNLSHVRFTCRWYQDSAMKNLRNALENNRTLNWLNLSNTRMILTESFYVQDMIQSAKGLNYLDVSGNGRLFNNTQVYPGFTLIK